MPVTFCGVLVARDGQAGFFIKQCQVQFHSGNGLRYLFRFSHSSIVAHIIRCGVATTGNNTQTADPDVIVFATIRAYHMIAYRQIELIQLGIMHWCTADRAVSYGFIRFQEIHHKASLLSKYKPDTIPVTVNFFIALFRVLFDIHLILFYEKIKSDERGTFAHCYLFMTVIIPYIHSMSSAVFIFFRLLTEFLKRSTVSKEKTGSATIRAYR